MEAVIPAECAGVKPGETQEEPGPESRHRVQNLQVLGLTPSSIKSERRWIKWPAANMTAQWNQFNNDVDQIMEPTGKGDEEIPSHDNDHCQNRSRTVWKRGREERCQRSLLQVSPWLPWLQGLEKLMEGARMCFKVLQWS